MKYAGLRRLFPFPPLPPPLQELQTRARPERVWEAEALEIKIRQAKAVAERSDQLVEELSGKFYNDVRSISIEQEQIWPTIRKAAGDAVGNLATVAILTKEILRTLRAKRRE